MVRVKLVSGMSLYTSAASLEFSLNIRRQNGTRMNINTILQDYFQSRCVGKLIPVFISRTECYMRLFVLFFLFGCRLSPVLSVQRVLVSVGNPRAGLFISLLLFLFLFLGQRPFEILDHAFFLFLGPVALDFLKERDTERKNKRQRERRREPRFHDWRLIRNKNLCNLSLHLGSPTTSRSVGSRSFVLDAIGLRAKGGDVVLSSERKKERTEETHIYDGNVARKAFCRET